MKDCNYILPGGYRSPAEEVESLAIFGCGWLVGCANCNGGEMVAQTSSIVLSPKVSRGGTAPDPRFTA
jgi:hypothetical protein